MKFAKPYSAISLMILVFFASCKPAVDENQKQSQEYINQYEEVILTADFSELTASEKEMIPLLIAATEIIDDIFWLQSYGNTREHLMDILDDPYAREYALINYGPWGRLEGHTAFYSEFDDKPLGASFYPAAKRNG